MKKQQKKVKLAELKRLKESLEQEIYELEDDGILWHYTSYKTFLEYIFKGNTISLRASHYRSLNDDTEDEYIYQLLQKYWNPMSAPRFSPLHEIIDTHDDLSRFKDLLVIYKYIFSLSKASDSLYQWHAYANGEDGIALGFNADILSKTNERFTYHKTKPFILSNEAYHSDCLYVDDIPPPEIDEIGLYTSDSHKYKHPAYMFEREKRLVFEFQCKPDLEKIVDDKAYILFNAPIESLQAIKVTPKDKERKIYLSALNFIEKNELNIELTRSSIPFK